MPDLVSYIRELQRKGYNIPQIKGYLLKYGYPENVIDHAIYNISHGTEIKHTIHITKTGLAAIAIIVLGLITASFFIFRPEKAPSELLDISIDSIDTAVAPGDFLSASIELSNMGSSNRYDIYLKSEIFNENTKERATFKSETVALETTKSHNINIRIPADAKEGNYILQVTGRLPPQAAIATAMFTIKAEQAEPTCFDNIQNQGEEDIDCGGPCQACKKCPSCDDNDPITIDYCDAATNFECRHEKPAECGDDICSETENTNTCPDDCIETAPPGTIWDELERIKELANSNCEKARQECENIDTDFKDKCLQNVGEICLEPDTCDKIDDQYYKERCFYNVAKALNKKILCENIQHEDRRNSCYIHFAVSGDYSVCDKITNEYVKKSCNTLKQTAQ